tara:strand:- start:2014 stop:3312 length:1299 start_codon:yes stop_codon:yes gene_type:complete
MKLFSIKMPKITVPKFKVLNPETGRQIDINGPTANKLKKRYTGLIGWINQKLHVESDNLNTSLNNSIKSNEKVRFKKKKINAILSLIGVFVIILAGYLGLSKKNQKGGISMYDFFYNNNTTSNTSTTTEPNIEKEHWQNIKKGFYVVMTALVIVIIYLGVKAYQESKVEEEDLGIQMREVERRKLRNSVFWYDFNSNLKTYYNIQFLEKNDSFFVEKKYMTIKELENVDSCPGNNMKKGNRPISKDDYDCDGAPINEILHDRDSFEQREDNKLGWIKINQGSEKDSQWEIDPQGIYKDKIQRKLWISKQDDKYRGLKGGNKSKLSSLNEVRKKHFNFNCRISNQKYDNLVTTTLHFMQQNESFIKDKDLDKNSKIIKVIVPYYHKIILKNSAIILKCKEKILKRKNITDNDRKKIIDFVSFQVKYLKNYLSK